MTRAWSSLPTAQQRLRCARPFSFFFDIVQTHWKSESEEGTALHRICTLARKQNAQHIVVESVIGRPDVAADIDALDESYGGGGAAECVAISFFGNGDETTPLADLNNGDLIGQLTLINYREPRKTEFTHSYIFDAFMQTPALPGSGAASQLLNNYLCTGGDFTVEVLGKAFTVGGVYYCQQNGQTHACAHASLRMALNAHKAASQGRVTNAEINTLLNITPPCSGLTLGQIVRTIEILGGMHADVVDCSELPAAKYMTILASIVESGDRALLVFKTAFAAEHVVCVYGHTRNSDEWHPQAVDAYAGPQSAPYYSSSMWIDHFLIHDDNFGPYYTLSSRALETNDIVTAHWVIAIRSRTIEVLADVAETSASVALLNIVPVLAPLPWAGRWLTFIATKQHTFVLRAILLERAAYIAHIQAADGHDGSAATADELLLLDALPEFFWMVEFSLPALYTGNRSKLGEVLISATETEADDDDAGRLLGIRAPGTLALRADEDDLDIFEFGLTAHSPVYRPNVPRDEW